MLLLSRTMHRKKAVTDNERNRDECKLLPSAHGRKSLIENHFEILRAYNCHQRKRMRGRYSSVVRWREPEMSVSCFPPSTASQLLCVSPLPSSSPPPPPPPLPLLRWPSVPAHTWVTHGDPQHRRPIKKGYQHCSLHCSPAEMIKHDLHSLIVTLIVSLEHLIEGLMLDQCKCVHQH